MLWQASKTVTVCMWNANGLRICSCCVLPK